MSSNTYNVICVTNREFSYEDQQKELIEYFEDSTEFTSEFIMDEYEDYFEDDTSKIDMFLERYLLSKTIMEKAEIIETYFSDCFLEDLSQESFCNYSSPLEKFNVTISYVNMFYSFCNDFDKFKSNSEYQLESKFMGSLVDKIIELNSDFEFVHVLDYPEPTYATAIGDNYSDLINESPLTIFGLNLENFQQSFEKLNKIIYDKNIYIYSRSQHDY